MIEDVITDSYDSFLEKEGRSRLEVRIALCTRLCRYSSSKRTCRRVQLGRKCLHGCVTVQEFTDRCALKVFLLPRWRSFFFFSIPSLSSLAFVARRIFPTKPLLGDRWDSRETAADDSSYLFGNSPSAGNNPSISKFSSPRQSDRLV